MNQQLGKKPAVLVHSTRGHALWWSGKSSPSQSLRETSTIHWLRSRQVLKVGTSLIFYIEIFLARKFYVLFEQYSFQLGNGNKSTNRQNEACSCSILSKVRSWWKIFFIHLDLQ